MDKNKLEDKDLDKITGGTDYYDSYLGFEVGCFYLKTKTELSPEQFYAKITKIPYIGDRVYIQYVSYSYNKEFRSLELRSKGNKVLFTSFENNFSKTKTEFNDSNVLRIIGE